MNLITHCQLAKIYKNFSGKSFVTAYETGPDFIKVEFRDGRIIKFSFRTAGVIIIFKMKRLAACGQGLGEYIASRCRIKEQG